MAEYGDKVSIIMACYNCEKTLAKSIESIIGQTYKNWILICCDDGSTDHTYQILCDYKNRYPDRFLLLQNKVNSKLPHSLNRCLENVKTEYVARMDADDISHPERIEKQVRYLSEHPDIDLVGTGVTINNGKENIGSIIKTPYPTRKTMLKDNAFSHATILTYKRVYDQLGGYSEDPTAIRVEDVDLWCRFLAADLKGYNMPDELYTILENDDAIKRRTFRARLNSAITRQRGYKLMGFSGFTCIYPYVNLLKCLIPTSAYKAIYRARHK